MKTICGIFIIALCGPMVAGQADESDAAFEALFSQSEGDASGDARPRSEVLIEQLRDKDPEVRISAAAKICIEAFDLTKDPADLLDTFPVLVTLLRDKDKRVVAAAIDAVATIGPDYYRKKGPEGSVPVMLAIAASLKEKDNDLSRTAADALATFGPLAAPAVKDMARAIEPVQKMKGEAAASYFQDRCFFHVEALRKIGAGAIDAVDTLQACRKTAALAQYSGYFEEVIIDIHNACAEEAGRNRQYDEAVAWCDKSLAVARNFEAYRRRGLMKAAKGQTEDGLRDIEQARSYAVTKLDFLNAAKPQDGQQEARQRQALDLCRRDIALATADLEGLSSPERVRLKTTLGDIVVELYAKGAPTTTANFLRYVNEGGYDGTIFHRVIGNFMIQGGGFSADLAEKATHEPIANESSKTLRNVRGTIAMARTNDPHSATSQFFINLVDNLALDIDGPYGGYTVFGRVVSGMDVVDAVSGVKTTTRVAKDGKTPLANNPAEAVIITSAKTESRER